MKWLPCWARYCLPVFPTNSHRLGYISYQWKPNNFHCNNFLFILYFPSFIANLKLINLPLLFPKCSPSPGHMFSVLYRPWTNLAFHSFLLNLQLPLQRNNIDAFDWSIFWLTSFYFDTNSLYIPFCFVWIDVMLKQHEIRAKQWRTYKKTVKQLVATLDKILNPLFVTYTKIKEHYS